MKLIIDIDEEIYKSIKIGMRNRDDMAKIGEAIEDGIPLDKIRAEIIQSIQNGTLKIESGNEELFRIIDKYKAEIEPQESEG